MVLSYLHILFKHMLDYLCGSAIFSVYLTSIYPEFKLELECKTQFYWVPMLTQPDFLSPGGKLEPPGYPHDRR